MAKKKTKKRSVKKYSGTELEQGYRGKSADLFLDKPFMALSNLSTNKNGKEVPVNVQISDYLKSMKMLVESSKKLETTIEKSFKALNSKVIMESSIVKRKIKGRTYSTTKRMIEVVKSYDMGKISSEDLKRETSWAEDPSAAITIARIIGKDT